MLFDATGTPAKTYIFYLIPKDIQRLNLVKRNIPTCDTEPAETHRAHPSRLKTVQDRTSNEPAVRVVSGALVAGARLKRHLRVLRHNSKYSEYRLNSSHRFLLPKGLRLSPPTCNRDTFRGFGTKSVSVRLRQPQGRCLLFF